MKNEILYLKKKTKIKRTFLIHKITNYVNSFKKLKDCNMLMMFI